MTRIFGLRRLVFGTNAFVPLKKTEFDEIKNAISGLMQCVFLEQKFDFIIENYLEFEKNLLDATADHMILGAQESHWYQAQRDLFNRRIMNLLSTGKTYVDTAPHHVNNLLGRDSDGAKSVSIVFNNIYDARLGYRAMSAMRNFVQHRGLPVHGSTYGSSWIDRDNGRMMFSTVNPYLHPDELRDGGKFKAAVLEELEQEGTKVDLKFLIRDYIEGLWDVHSKIRGLVNEKCINFENIFNEAITKFEMAYPEEKSIVGLAIVEQEDAGNVIKEQHLDKKFIEYRQKLFRKNSGLVNLSKRYVSGEIAS